MQMKRKFPAIPISERFPPSEACDCTVCRAYCARPGWWSVEQARLAFLAGYGKSMMLELSPDHSFGVLSPAFRGCEGMFALQTFAHNGCTFLHRDRCKLHGTQFFPLECSFCHHSREGQGMLCHDALARDWDSPAGKLLVKDWIMQIYREEEFHGVDTSSVSNRNADCIPPRTLLL